MDLVSYRQVVDLLAAVEDVEWHLERVAAGASRLVGVLGGAAFELEVSRDREPASEGDLQFVGASLGDLRRLVALRETGARLDPEEALLIRERYEAASPGPWVASIEADGGLAGCDVILVSDRDDQADMYLWVDGELAPSRLFRVVAFARQAIPDLLEHAR
ncbi:MAG: hypothetical protein CVT62_07310 [Actinobacteria bacterium HGW-Actinobacteria-2]|nr:MAG: hypothetical protein CVT62_07310 [Actinobacteria bacterium HGW-Actinobacteria-2]